MGSKQEISRAVVTGGAGFIGSTLVDALLAEGYEVLVIDDLSTGNRENLDAAMASGKVELLTECITSAAAAKAVKEYAASVVFHLAAQMNVRRSVDEPAFDADSNVTGTVTMLEAARLAGAKAFVFASTGGAIYGEQDYFPADENHPIRPKSPYGVSKRAAELYLEYYGQNAGLKTTALRFANVYGPRQNPKGEAGVVAIFADRLLRGQELRVNGSGTQTRDFIFVDEVVKACLLAAQDADGPAFSVYNVGKGLETSINDIVTCFQSIAAERSLPTCSVVYGPALAGEQQRSVIDSALLSKCFQWQSTIDVLEGLNKTLDYFQDRLRNS